MKRVMGSLAMLLLVFGLFCPAFAQESAEKEKITIVFSTKNALVARTYFVKSARDVRGVEGLDVSSGSGFALQSDNTVYFITAAHVITKGIDDLFGEKAGFAFRDYTGTTFIVKPLFVAWNLDLVIFTLSKDDESKIQPETLTHTIAGAAIEEQIVTCGFDINNSAPLFPVCLANIIKAKITHLDLNYSGFDFTINNIIAITPGLEYGFSGGPAFNEKGELVGVNIATSRGGRFGYLENALAITELIKKYTELKKNELGESPPVNINKKKQRPLP